jgi:AcrR family transcriptional regulator
LPLPNCSVARGYASTSVADIQVACGLTPGSGALYKHFPSKLALLEEVLRQHADSVDTQANAFMANVLDGFVATPDNVAGLLRLGADLVWQTMERDQAVIRITLRDLEPFPGLLDEFWNTIVGTLYQQGSQLIKQLLVAMPDRVADPEATAGVLLASLTYFPILEALIHRTPGSLSRERYIEAWLEQALCVLAIDS